VIRRAMFVMVVLCLGSTNACRGERTAGGSPPGTSAAAAAAGRPGTLSAPSAVAGASPIAEASALPVPTESASIPSTPPTASSDHREEIDFEDAFAYGSADPAVAASAALADPSKLASNVTYESYFNDRFGFELDVPRVFRAMPEPTNGDGMQWRMGADVVVTASGMNMSGEDALACANSKNVTAHTEAKRACWSTGKRSGFIYWQRERLEHDVLYSLRFQYRESFKDRMAPIVLHMNASWKI
jgi:hypothetical protein